MRVSHYSSFTSSSRLVRTEGKPWFAPTAAAGSLRARWDPRQPGRVHDHLHTLYSSAAVTGSSSSLDASGASSGSGSPAEQAGSSMQLA
jgi:hypothetical protein